MYGTTAVTISLPEELDRVERSLLVSRSTLLIVALQLALLVTAVLALRRQDPVSSLRSQGVVNRW
ncbi:hypothetical protein [Streptomyces sp. NPDC048825]|uniref:hypothetical protein n=1 Tax=Streptomyces sp. NPDC048825 TaxID=3365592 RepID=UPI003717C4EA